MSAAIARPRFHYAWVVAAVTFLTLLATAGVGSTRAVLIVPLEQEFGWSRATISGAIAINLLLPHRWGRRRGAPNRHLRTAPYAAAAK